MEKDVLVALKDRGVDSTVLLARLEFMENEGLRRNLAQIAKSPRAHPDILPTQASGRWSTKSPPIGGFDRQFWKEHHTIIHPDLEEWWLEWDWKGIEARMFTAYAQDPEDLDWFSPGKDIHLLTAQKYLFESESIPEGGRHLSKNFRYGVLQYGQSERAVHAIPGMAEVGLSKAVALRRARSFLSARPGAQAFKHSIWEQAIQKKEIRTFQGRRRWLWGKAKDRAKDGMAHMISGSVADMMDWSLIQLFSMGVRLVLNKHDGAIVRVKDLFPVESILPHVKGVVEREWEFAGGKMKFPANWYVWTPDGKREEVHD